MIPLVKPSIDATDRESILSVLREKDGRIWLSQGPKVAELEEKVAIYLGMPKNRVVACSSGTAALHLALEAMHLGPGSKIACPSLTFIATANAITMAGLNPEFIDVDEDCTMLESCLGETDIEGYLPVHHGGIANAWADPICKDNDMVHDACPSFGAEYEGQKLGSGQHSTCFSLHALKTLTCGEGGIYVGYDAEEVRLLRSHGMTKSPLQRSKETEKESTVFESYIFLGHNYRMSELAAALALSQLAKLNRIINRRREVATIYDANLSGFCRCIGQDQRETSAAQSYMIELESEERRGQVLQELRAQGIECKRGIMASHREPVYQGYSHKPLPMTERLADRTLRLPIYEMRDSEIEEVLKVARSVLA